MTGRERERREGLSIGAQVEAIYLDKLEQLAENLRNVHYWRDSESIQLWTTIGQNSDRDLETLVDAEIAVRSHFPLRSFRFHILISGSPTYEHLRKAIPDDAVVIYPRTRLE